MTEQLAAETRAEAVVDTLGLLYHDGLDPDEFMLFPEDDGALIEAETDVSDWQRTYGGRDAFECLVRTILSQNTSDVASQPAHEALLSRYGDDGDGDDGDNGGDSDNGGDNDENGGDSDEFVTGDDGPDLAESLAAADRGELAETIRSAGLYNQKSEKIIEAAERVLAEYGSAAAFDEFVTGDDPADVRETLLDMNGVGPKTADCVLLFSGGTAGVFPVDTHVHRIARRLGLAPPDADHEAVRRELERDVPPDKCGFGHTAMIQFGRDYCTARKPACLDGPEACPLASLCDQVGVDTLTGEVVDPGKTVK